MNETLNTAFGLLGGLAMFLFGMNMMSDGLQKAAGERMKSILGFLTQNAVFGVFAGAITTAVIQSSSATTVMVIGFISANLMTLPQGISVILGANIGTTMTAQLLAFKISDYIWPIIFIGFIINFVSKNEKVKNIGITILGFGILFVGIETMGSVMEPLATSSVFTNLMSKVRDIPALGVLLGTCMTLVVQSSSATIAVLQNIGQSKNAKRAAIAHSVFNICGTLIFIWFIPAFARFVEFISPKGPEIEVISRQIANAHTAFNVLNTILWIPFIWVLVKIVCFIIPDKKNENVDKMQPMYLDRGMIHQAVVALDLVSKEVEHCNHLILEVLEKGKKAIIRNDSQLIEQARQMVESIKELQDAINSYMVLLFSEGTLTEEQASYATDVMYVLEDMVRVSQRMQEILDIVEKGEKGLHFSKQAAKEIDQNMDNVIELYSICSEAFLRGSEVDSERIRQKIKDIHEMKQIARNNHKERMKLGQCRLELTTSFSNVFTNMERIGNNSLHIAEAAKNKIHLQYLNTLQENNV